MPGVVFPGATGEQLEVRVKQFTSLSLTKYERLSVLRRNHSSYLVPGLRATHVAQRLPPPSPSEPLGESGSSDISPPLPEDKNTEQSQSRARKRCSTSMLAYAGMGHHGFQTEAGQKKCSTSARHRILNKMIKKKLSTQMRLKTPSDKTFFCLLLFCQIQLLINCPQKGLSFVSLSPPFPPTNDSLHTVAHRQVSQSSLPKFSVLTNSSLTSREKVYNSQ